MALAIYEVSYTYKVARNRMTYRGAVKVAADDVLAAISAAKTWAESMRERVVAWQEVRLLARADA